MRPPPRRSSSKSRFLRRSPESEFELDSLLEESLEEFSLGALASDESDLSSEGLEPLVRVFFDADSVASAGAAVSATALRDLRTGLLSWISSIYLIALS